MVAAKKKTSTLSKPKKETSIKKTASKPKKAIPAKKAATTLKPKKETSIKKLETTSKPKKETKTKELKLNIFARKPAFLKPQKKKIVKKANPEEPSSFIVIRNAPYGFFEEPCYKYFSQYGQVKRVRVIRNKKGGFSGKIYVGFKYAEVASIVVSVLNKSLMMGENVVKCRQLLNREVPAAVKYGSKFGKRHSGKTAYLKKRIQKAHVKKFKENPQAVADFINKQLVKAKENGIDYTFDFSKKFAAASEEQKVRDAHDKEKIAQWLKNFK
jgi:hypothetical protein